MDFIHSFLKRFFYNLGLEVGKRPKVFIGISLLIFLSLALGLKKLELNNDSEYLFTVENSRTKSDRDLIERYFSFSSVDFDPSRLTRPGHFAKLIVTPKDENQSADLATRKEVTELNYIMHSISCSDNGHIYNYSMICAKIDGQCYENKILSNLEVGLNDRVVEYNMTGDLSQSKAILLKYFISVTSPEEDLIGRKWENSVIKELNYREEKWNTIKVSRLTFQSLTEEPEINSLSVLPYIYVTAMSIVVFTMFTCKSSDWLESKSVVGLMGIISSLLGASGACGLLGFIGVPFIGINMAIPFITLGIGLDDTFLMLASWRKTSRCEPMCNRLAACYSDSAVSISITTITDILSFYTGILSPIPSIRIFSIYAGTCIFGIFICHVFFFGAIITINGSFEEIILSRMHSNNMECKRGKAPQMSQSFSTGEGLSLKLKDPKQESTKLYIIEDIFSEFLYKKPVKITIMLVYLLYLYTSLFGLNQLQDGLLREHLVRYDSYMSDYFITERKYFSNSPMDIQVVVTSPLDYYSTSTQSKIADLLEELTKNEYLADEIQENWLQYFSKYIEEKEINITSNAEFILALKNLFSQNISLRIANDIVFNEAKTEILASRFMVQSYGISDVNKEKMLYKNIRKVLENTDLQVAIYHPYFDFIELHITTSEQTIKLVGLAALIVMFVSLLIIPSVLGSLCVAFSVMSIELGILGFCSLLGIRLDLICLLNLIFCIGFSVDFSAHVAYSFYSCADTIADIDRLKNTIHSISFPIIQGATSTLIGVSFLVFVPSYIFQSFFKIVFLVMIFSIIHALFIVPVILSVIKPMLPNSTKTIYHVNS